MIGKIFIQQSDCTGVCTFTSEHYHPEREGGANMKESMV